MKKGIFSWGTILVLPALLFSAEVRAEGNVPRLINFQSVLTDDGGNPLADGKHAISFRILDSAEQPLYQEKQEIESVKGVVSAMIGAGVEPVSGVPTGGILPEEIDPARARFLEVTVEGMPKQVLEINSVPFALYSEKSLSVAEGAVGSSGLAKKSVTLEHLADGLAQEIFGQMTTADLPAGAATKGDLQALKQEFQGAGGAGQIGVDGRYTYSRGQNVQQVLKDLDSAVQQRNMDLERTNVSLQSQITREANTRTGADADLNCRIDHRDCGGGDSSVLRQLNDHKESIVAHGANGDIVGSNTLEANINSVMSALRGSDNGSGVLQNLVAPNESASDLPTLYLANINAGGVDVRGLGERVGDVETRLATLSPLNALPRIVAWGNVICTGCSEGSCVLQAGYNINNNPSCSGGARVVTLAFSAAQNDGNYAVVVTLLDAGTFPPNIGNRAPSSFEVVSSMTSPRFTFIVVKNP